MSPLGREIIARKREPVSAAPVPTKKNRTQYLWGEVCGKGIYRELCKMLGGSLTRLGLSFFEGRIIITFQKREERRKRERKEERIKRVKEAGLTRSRPSHFAKHGVLRCGHSPLAFGTFGIASLTECRIRRGR